jgi:hypothetical protein
MTFPAPSPRLRRELGKQVVAEEFHEEAVVELAVGAALVLAHHADRAEADPRIAADRPLRVRMPSFST